MRSSIEDAQKRLKLCPISNEIMEQLSRLDSDTPENTQVTKKWLLDRDDRLLNACETDSHIALLESFDCRFHDMALELTTQFISENNCVTVADKMQAEITVGAFIRILDCSRKLNEALDPYFMPNKERNALIALLSKQIDRATRQFHSALSTFKYWKMSPVSLNINTNNAFVAQNIQQ